jgi:hypothetical protein
VGDVPRRANQKTFSIYHLSFFSSHFSLKTEIANGVRRNASMANEKCEMENGKSLDWLLR